ncbi:hypothetical protein [Raoultella terrigena]|uniref:hypothetical protein n=1 Tax=Raoultella terrigena TaxID=577 RepID=UPI001F51CA84|nr:hypothetical protein [Raoultella terrigena]MCI1034840.1 hypothetical protein [Raoultella terrigena]
MINSCVLFSCFHNPSSVYLICAVSRLEGYIQVFKAKLALKDILEKQEYNNLKCHMESDVSRVVAMLSELLALGILPDKRLHYIYDLIQLSKTLLSDDLFSDSWSAGIFYGDLVKEQFHAWRKNNDEECDFLTYLLDHLW